MKIKNKKILLLYKKSAFRLYFLDRHSSLRGKRNFVINKELTNFQKAHDQHYSSLKIVTKILLTHGIKFSESYRGRKINYNLYDLIITVGGDGTFLEAARNVERQVILGVNSAPDYSVGRYCVATANNFEKVLMRILNNTFNPALLQRLRAAFDYDHKPVHVLNDLLVCHSNPAVLCRYVIQRGKTIEEQRSSGVWVSTPAGSSGALFSAGGVKMNPYVEKFQYIARELYPARSQRYYLKKGILAKKETLKITSLMRQGIVFIDGAHQRCPLEYGNSITVSLSSHPIRTIDK